MNLAMACLEIVGLKADLLIAVDVMQRLGCVHIDRATDSPEILVRPLSPLEETVRSQEDLRLLVTQIAGLLETMGRGQKAVALVTVERSRCREDARKGIEVVAPQLQSLISRREGLHAELDSLPRYELTVRKLLPIVPMSAHDPSNALIGVLVNRAHAGVLDMVSKQALDLTGGQGEVAVADVDTTMRALLIVCPRKSVADVEALLGRADVSRLRLPPELGESLPSTAVAVIRNRLGAIPAEIKALDHEQGELAEAWRPRLLSWHAALSDELSTYAVMSEFGETDTSFVVVGWVPVPDVPRVKSTLDEALHGQVLVEELPLTPERLKHAPIALQNPPLARPFQSLVGLVDLPRYGSLDPTRLMALFLPLFFGMMLGDVGYGVLLLVISLLLRRRLKPGVLRDLSAVLAMGSVWAVGFGMLFGEAFGTLGEHIGLHPVWMDRANPSQVTALLLLTIGVGAAHITLGLVLGVWQAARERSRSELLGRGGMLVGLAGLFLLVAVLVDLLPGGFVTPAMAGLIVGIVLLGLPMGWLGLLVGPIEFIGLIGNILSYLRIAAIGLASVYLARVANDMAGMLGSVIVGVIVAVLLHALNLVMGAFSPTIHSLRLHYVEFFRKFYEGGGRPYQPFRRQSAPDH